MLAGVCPQLVIPQVQRLWHLILTVLADRGQGNDLPNHGNQGMGCPFFKQLRHETLRNSGNRLGPLLVSSPSFGAQDIHPGNTVCSSCVRDQDSQVEWTCQQHLKMVSDDVLKAIKTLTLCSETTAWFHITVQEREKHSDFLLLCASIDCINGQSQKNMISTLETSLHHTNV